MSNFMEEAIQVRSKTNKLAVRALKAIAKERNKPYKEIRALFTKDHDELITQSFWQKIWRKTKKYYQVDYCSGCEKFNLY